MVAPPPVLAVRGGAIGFGDAPLFTAAELSLAPGERACLVGRNGSGKSTLLKVMAGTLPLDHGERYAEPGLSVGYLPQDPVLPLDERVADYVARGTHLAHEVAEVLDRLRLAGERRLGTLSGGEARRAALAAALIGAPGVLLLDEPTNHLDLPTILWLEQTLKAQRAAQLIISHDRAFLATVTTRTFWLHRGRLLANPRGHDDFARWSDEVYREAENEARRLGQKLKAEAHWLTHGITARRRRNQGRLRKLAAMRDERRTLLAGRGRARLTADSGAGSGRLVIEAEHIAKRFGDRVIVRDFSTRVMRGDRIGVIGPNGAGKTTLLRLLTGGLAPDDGTVRLGTRLTVAGFDQMRAQLDPAATPWETLVTGGGDSLMVQGRQRHVVAYLRDFLFDERQAKAPISTLSGGERNRLLLAKILAQPSNMLVLDEPTNDLDADTLDLLREMLDDYAGTVLLVSHDRAFLDEVVTSTIAVEGDGTIVEYAGGYSDYLLQRRVAAPPKPSLRGAAPRRDARRARPAEKLGYRAARELAELPDRLTRLANAKARLESALGQPDFYTTDPAGYRDTVAKLDEVAAAIAAAEDRWLELETRREAFAGTSDG